jgi:hypothetical protein
MMAVAFDTPVSAIEGIGPSIEDLLRPKGVHTVYDLLRAPSPALHKAVAEVASLQQVRSWRQMALLLEVAMMTPQWAEALVKARITSISELRRRHLAEVRSVFADAGSAHSIPDVPSDDEIAAMLADAALLDFAGAITGTVTNRRRRPLPGVRVIAGDGNVTTDDRGRFRITRLLLGRTVALKVAKDKFQTATISVLASPTSAVRVISVTLLPEIRTRPAPADRSAGRISELHGDMLPLLQGQTVTSAEAPPSSLEASDLLLVGEFNSDATKVKLVSKLEYDGSRFVVHWVWAPKTALPEGASAGDYLIKTSTGFRKVTMNPRKLAHYRQFLRRYRGGQIYSPPDRLLAPIGGVSWV